MWWLAGAVVVLIFIAVFLSDIRIRVKYSRGGSNDEAEAAVKALYGFVYIRKKVPALEYKPGIQGVRFQVAEQNHYYSKDDFQFFISLSKQLIHHMKQFKEWANDSLHEFHVVEFRWETELGLGDAAETGMAAGAVWGVKSAAVGAVSRWVTMEERPALTVNPLYQETAFRTRVLLRANIRMYKLLFISLMLFVRVFSYNGGWKVWIRALRRSAAHKKRLNADT